MGVTMRSRIRAVVVAGIAALVMAGPAMGNDARDQTVLDTVAKDLGLSLLAKPEDTLVRLPLAPQRWNLFGRVQPYASLGPRTYQSADDVVGLAAPLRESDEFARGASVGAGMSWHLSDRFELFGEYQLLNMGRRAAQPDSGISRRDFDAPGLKGGLSIRF